MHIKKIKKILICIFCSFVLAVSVCTVGAIGYGTSSTDSAQIPYESYTYWVDYNTSEKVPVYSKPTQKVKKVVTSIDMELSSTAKIEDITYDNAGNIYLLNSGDSDVVVLNSRYEYTGKIKISDSNGEQLVFTDAKGIFIDHNNKLYIADTKNARVIVSDTDGKLIKLLTLPKSDKIPSNFKYQPVKIAVDSKNYTYITSYGSYYGAILYSPDMEFLGFFGANTVKASAADVIKSIYKRLFSNDVKRAADEISLPFTFTDIVIDKNDFVYTITGKSGKDQIQHGQVCKFNPGGKDILNASSINFADYAIGSLKRQSQTQDLSCIAVDNDGYFYALDTTYGRIFMYDSQCNLINVFGGSFGDGFQKGTFVLPSGITVLGDDILVSDSMTNSVTIFSTTEYGIFLKKTQNKAISGEYADAKKDFEKIIEQDSNSQMAYRGLANAYLEVKNYKKAMEYAKLGVDREIYSQAFEKVRTDYIERHFILIVFLLVVLIGGIVALYFYLTKNNKTLIKNMKIKTALSSVSHPVESFRLVKEKNYGSVLISSIILVLYYIIRVTCDTKGGFAFTVFDSSSYNAIYVLISTIGFVLLWVISNWLVCTLAGGIGTIRQIYIVSCYSLIPLLFYNVCQLVFTHILIPEEAAFLGAFKVICIIYALFMLIIGIMRVHDYEFGKFVATAIFTVIGMMIITFLLFLIFLLSQQVFNWIRNLIVEIRYR